MLVIESQPDFTRELCREIYKHSTVAQIIAFGLRRSQGHWMESDHEHVRAVAFDCCTMRDLVSFLSRRDALRAEEYPCMADLETLGVKVDPPLLLIGYPMESQTGYIQIQIHL